MNKQRLKKPYVWLKRFRYRQGYGVHSPFAFDFITNVIYEKTLYYGYAAIENSNSYKQIKKHSKEKHDSKKINRLLFRIINRFQPGIVVELGPPTTTSRLYLQAAKRGITYKTYASLAEFESDNITLIDFLYIHYDRNACMLEEAIIKILPYIHTRSVVVIGGIHYSVQAKKVWDKLLADKHVIITFDLYDLGIVFFDDKMNKQQYIVNF